MLHLLKIRQTYLFCYLPHSRILNLLAVLFKGCLSLARLVAFSCISRNQWWCWCGVEFFSFVLFAFFLFNSLGGIYNLSIDSTLDAMRQRSDPNKDLFLDFFPLKRSERTRLTTCVYSFFWAGNGFRMVVYFFRVRVSVLCTRTP